MGASRVVCRGDLKASRFQPHTDTGADARGPARRGVGLSGVRERVEHYRGDMTAGVDTDGVFRVSIRLPLHQPDRDRDAIHD